MNASRKQAIDSIIQKIDKVIDIPQESHSRQLVYILLQVNRIGQLSQEIHQIKSIFRGAFDEIILITPPLDERVNREVFQIFTRGMRWVVCSDQEVLNVGWESLGAVQRANRTYALFNPSSLYQLQSEKIAQGVPPQYISLTSEDEARGLELRRAFNIPEDAPIVTLHVREPGYLPNLQYHSFRDANIETYIPAIKFLIEQGFYVVRLGDPTMQRLNSNTPQFIDAPFHPAYNHFVDPYFLWTSHFHVAATAGPYSIARAFNKPILAINAYICAVEFGGDKDLYVHKKYFSHTLGRMLTYREVVLSPLVDFCMTDQFINHKVQLIDNTPEEILRSVAEMMQRLDGTYNPTASILAKNREDDSLAHIMRSRTQGPYPFFGHALCQARLSEEYIRCNPFLLGHHTEAII